MRRMTRTGSQTGNQGSHQALRRELSLSQGSQSSPYGLALEYEASTDLSRRYSQFKRKMLAWFYAGAKQIGDANEIGPNRFLAESHLL
jgi:hypothetical protein